MTRPLARIVPGPTQVELAKQQFITELTERARQAELDRVYRQRWEARRGAVQASVRRERKVLWYLAGAVLVLAAAMCAALIYALVSLGLPLLIAAVIAVVLAGSAGTGGCLTVVSVYHSH